MSSSSLPSWAVQCPLRYPYSVFGQGTDTVEECCKCQSQTKCQAAAAGVNYYNMGGIHAMMADDGVIDRCKSSDVIPIFTPTEILLLSLKHGYYQ